MASNSNPNERPSNLPSHKIFHVRERAGQKGFWQEIGVAFTNRDGSLSLKLNYLPLDFTKETVSLQVRPYEPKDDSRIDDSRSDDSPSDDSRSVEGPPADGPQRSSSRRKAA